MKMEPSYVCPHGGRDPLFCDTCHRDTIRRDINRQAWPAAAAVNNLADELGGYSAANQSEILRGDYTHVSEEDISLFKAAITDAGRP